MHKLLGVGERGCDEGGISLSLTYLLLFSVEVNSLINEGSLTVLVQIYIFFNKLL